MRVHIDREFFGPGCSGPGSFQVVSLGEYKDILFVTFIKDEYAPEKTGNPYEAAVIGSDSSFFQGVY